MRMNSSVPTQTGTDYDKEDNAAFYSHLKRDYNWFFSPLSDTMLDELKSLRQTKDRYY